jgi:hypothetical protein
VLGEPQVLVDPAELGSCVALAPTHQNLEIRPFSDQSGCCLQKVLLPLLVFLAGHVDHDFILVTQVETVAARQPPLSTWTPQLVRGAPALHDGDALRGDPEMPDRRVLHRFGDGMEPRRQMPRRPPVDRAGQGEPEPADVRVHEPHVIVAGVHKARKHRRTRARGGEASQHVRLEDRGVHQVESLGPDELTELANSTKPPRARHVPHVTAQIPNP